MSTATLTREQIEFVGLEILDTLGFEYAGAYVERKGAEYARLLAEEFDRYVFGDVSDSDSVIEAPVEPEPIVDTVQTPGDGEALLVALDNVFVDDSATVNVGAEPEPAPLADNWPTPPWEATHEPEERAEPTPEQQEAQEVVEKARTVTSARTSRAPRQPTDRKSPAKGRTKKG